MPKYVYRAVYYDGTLSEQVYESKSTVRLSRPIKYWIKMEVT